MNRSKKLSMGLKLGYSIGTFGESLTYNVFYLYFIFFLTTVVGISPAIAGTVSFIAVLWDSVTDPMVGYLSDNSKNTKGRRRPFIARFVIPLGLTVFLMFTDFGFLTGWTKVVYYLAINILFWFFFTATDIPYISLGAELTDDYNERTNIRSISTVFNYVGFIGASSGAILLVEKYAVISGSEKGGWSWMALVIAGFTILSFLISWLSTKGKEPIQHQIEEKIEKPHFFKTYLSTLSIKPYRYLLSFTLLFNIGMLLVTGVTIYFLVYNLGMTENQIATVFLVYALMVIVFSPILGAVSNKFDKKKIVLVSTFVSMMVCVIFWLVGVTATTVYIYSGAAALANASFFVIVFSMCYDICEVDEFNSGLRREGVIVAFFSFFFKFATSIGMWFSGIILEIGGFNADLIEQTPKALATIKNAYTILPGVLYGAAFIAFLNYPLTKAKFEQVKSALAAKKSGEEYSVDGLEKII